MENPTSHLSLKQKDALEKFRVKVSDILPPGSPELFLLRWLKVQNFDPDKAAIMYRESHEWRNKFGIDDIITMWKVPKIFESFTTLGMVGHDKEGCPLWIFPSGFWDMKGLLASSTLDNFVLNTVNLMERHRMEAEKQSKKLGRYIWKASVILDVENFDYTLAFSKSVWELLIRLARVFVAHYPDVLKVLFFVNGPPFLPLLNSMMKPFVHESVFKTLQLFNSDRSKWVPAILKYVDADQLPKHWGGTMVDPDGDPKCPSKVCIEGKFPKSGYVRNKKNLCKICHQTAVIDHGATLKLDFDVTQVGSEISWAFYSNGNDIDFMIHRDGPNGPEIVVPNSRPECYFSLVRGQVICKETGKYVVTFDNSYFKLMSKSLWYFVEVLPASSNGLEER